MRIFSLSKNSQLWIQATVMMCLVLFPACGKDLEKETFDVYLIDKKGQEKKVDTVTGISQCRMKAASKPLTTPAQKRLNDWSTTTFGNIGIRHNCI